MERSLLGHGRCLGTFAAWARSLLGRTSCARMAAESQSQSLRSELAHQSWRPRLRVASHFPEAPVQGSLSHLARWV
eukprot:5484466-Alexandrium_andersonii.AAC.1